MNKPAIFPTFSPPVIPSVSPFKVSFAERRKRNPYPLKEVVVACVAGGICVRVLYYLSFFGGGAAKTVGTTQFSRVAAPTKVTPARTPRATQAKIVGTTNVDHCSPAFTFERPQFQSKKDPLFKTG